MPVIQVSAREYKRIVAEVERQIAARGAKLPTEKHCLEAAFEAWQRLKELGWREAIYCPKDGTVFDSISAGSTGIHDCYYEGEWPDGSWWIMDAGDLWPAHPILFKLKPKETDHGEEAA